MICHVFLGNANFVKYSVFPRKNHYVSHVELLKINNKTIEVFNRGNLSRDFTYIDDIIAGVQRAIKLSKNKKFSKHRIYNLGNNSPVALNTMIKLLEDIIGNKAKKKLVSMQPGDVKKTFADIEKSKRELRFQPKTSLRQGPREDQGAPRGGPELPMAPGPLVLPGSPLA